MKDDPRGAAFGHGAENGHCFGATLRDYFATAALQGLITSHPDGLTGGIPSFASDAYLFADAMLAERAKERK